MTDDDPADLPRYVITRGGQPTPEELAALTVALTPVAAPAGDDEAEPAWVAAALQEGIGRRPFVSADDLASAPPLFT